MEDVTVGQQLLAPPAPAAAPEPAPAAQPAEGSAAEGGGPGQP
jgi:hypothetical protein